MTLRTPRRRISPRTKRRYRAIKEFLRRAIGSPSQPDIKINSSIAINVTDLKDKIDGLEHQLSEVNKHCRDLVCIESSRKDSQILGPNDDGDYAISLKDRADTASNGVETTVLYKTSESHYRKSDDSASVEKVYKDANNKDNLKSNDMATKVHVNKQNTLRKNKTKVEDNIKAFNVSQPSIHKHKNDSAYENFVSSYATTSYHSLMDPRASHGYKTTYPTRHRDKKYKHREHVETEIKDRKQKDHIKKGSPERVSANYELKHKHKTRNTRELDKEFIADIIKRQYRPVKMFGKTESGITQISAPICRDQEFPIRETIIEDSELCSCCVNTNKKCRYKNEHDLNDMRSICDTRLYSSKRQMRQKHQRRHDIYKQHHDVYNDSEQYDLIPVKEKASPKLRRKLTAEETIPYNYYKEVLPSPRTQRPKLNLKAQYYTEFEDYLMQRKAFGKNQSPQRYRNYPPHNDNIESNDSSELEFHKEKRKPQLSKNVNKEVNILRDAGTMSSLQSPVFNNKQSNVTADSTLNKTQDTDLSVDKTDKALSEIKDILQSFLQEIKKENTVSQCDNLDITARTAEKCLNDLPPDSPKLNATMIPNSGVSMNNFGIPQCNMPPNYMPPFTNPCCYPLLPVCPMNCVQNGYVLPSPSFTCACVNQSKEGPCSKHTTESNESQTVKTATETEELIKEIYKFVAQNSNNNQRHDYPEKMPESPKVNSNEDKILTSRSTGGCSKLSKHDAKVGTQNIKCYSKSCEAIGPRMASDTYYSRTNPTYSDTVLEKLSLEATGTDTDSEFSSESTIHDKKDLQDKQNRFSRVLRTFGFLKKKKDIIEELSESESTIATDIKHQKPPFRQEVTNYVMHDQEYYEPPPIPEYTDPYYSSSQEQRYSYTDHSRRHAERKHTARKSPMHASVLDHYESHKMSHMHGTASPYRSPRPHPSAPPYPNLYDVHHSQPQVPLCLKEIEVQSIGTQSERKISFFRKFAKKKQAPAPAEACKVDDTGARNFSTQTAGPALNTKPDAKPGLFNWKSFKAKVDELDKPENLKFTAKTQKQLNEQDFKMKKAMLKKLFNKRNPFSPRNLIVRTILGKDKSSFGQAPTLYKPKMIF